MTRVELKHAHGADRCARTHGVDHDREIYSVETTQQIKWLLQWSDVTHIKIRAREQFGDERAYGVVAPIGTAEARDNDIERTHECTT